MKLALKTLFLISVLVFLYITWAFVYKHDVYGLFFDDEVASNYGDFISGTFGFISVVLLVVTLHEQRQSFLSQQFQETFVKYINFNREIASNMKMIDPESGNEVLGNHVFRLIYVQFKKAYKIVNEFNAELGPKVENINNDELRQLSEIFGDKLVNRTLIDISYKVVFYGTTESGLVALRESLKYLDQGVIDVVVKRLRQELNCNAPLELRESLNAGTRAQAIKNENKYFAGCHDVLGHYFRNLYHTVKFLDQASVQQNKYEAMKMLRGLFSSQEQYLIAINAISDFGLSWEWTYPGNKAKRYITEYALIKNIASGSISGINLKSYFPNIKFEQTELINM